MMAFSARLSSYENIKVASGVNIVYAEIAGSRLNYLGIFNLP
jgi:hypothetical protein